MKSPRHRPRRRSSSGPLDAPAPEAPALDGPPGVWLTGRVRGLELAPDERVTLELEDFDQGLGKFYVELTDTDRVAIDLGAWMPTGASLPPHIWVRAKHPNTFDLVAAANRRPEPGPHEQDGSRAYAAAPGERIEFQGDLVFEPREIVIRGRVHVGRGHDAAKPASRSASTIRRRRRRSSWSRSKTRTASHVRSRSSSKRPGTTATRRSPERIHCAPDGRFELFVKRTTPGLFVAYSPWHRPHTLAVDFTAGPVVDVGDIDLEPGAEIEGRALFSGEPLERGWGRREARAGAAAPELRRALPHRRR